MEYKEHISVKVPDERLELLSDAVRKGEPIGFYEALEVIAYQEKLKKWKRENSRLRKILRWLIKWYKLQRGWKRLFIWHVCPKCNHDAPELYDCDICEYYKKLPRHFKDQTKEQKTNVWGNYKKYLDR